MEALRIRRVFFRYCQPIMYIAGLAAVEARHFLIWWCFWSSWCGYVEVLRETKPEVVDRPFCVAWSSEIGGAYCSRAFMEVLWDDLDLEGTVAFRYVRIAHVECWRFLSFMIHGVNRNSSRTLTFDICVIRRDELAPQKQEIEFIELHSKSWLFWFILVVWFNYTVVIHTESLHINPPSIPVNFRL